MMGFRFKREYQDWARENMAKKHTVKFVWGWEPEGIGGKKLILVQEGVTESKPEWAVLTDAIQSIARLDFVESVNRDTANNKVYHVEFVDVPTLAQLKNITTMVKNVADAAGFDWYRGMKMTQNVAERLRDRPPTVAELPEAVAAGSVTPGDVKKLRDSMLRESMIALQSSIHNGAMTYKEAFDQVYTLVTGRVPS